MAPDIDAKIASLFEQIDARTAAMTSAKARSFLNTQIVAWEDRERQLLDWCRHKSGANPVPDLDAYQVAGIIIDLFSRLDALRSARAA